VTLSSVDDAVLVVSRSEEVSAVRASVTAVRDILSCVNAQVDEHQRQLQLMDIYRGFDARSVTLFSESTFTV